MISCPDVAKESLLSDDDLAACLEYADHFQVSPDVHPADFLVRFLIDHPAFDTGRQAMKYYFEDGHTSAKKLETILGTICDFHEEPIDLLEFASGYGMVTRHLRHVKPSCRVTACDIHKAAVDFIRDTIGVNTVLSANDPNDFGVDSKFTVVFALSFFSHMPKRTFAMWLEKLFNLVRPGGVLIFTTHGLQSRVHFGSVTFDNDGFFFLPDSEQKDLSTDNYGSAVATPWFVLSKCSALENANLNYFAEAYWWGHQDLYVIRRLDEDGSQPLNLRLTGQNARRPQGRSWSAARLTRGLGKLVRRLMGSRFL